MVEKFKLDEKIEIIVELLQSVGLNVEVFHANAFKYYQALSTVSIEELIKGINYALDNSIPIVTERGTIVMTELIKCVEKSLDKGMVA